MKIRLTFLSRSRHVTSVSQEAVLPGRSQRPAPLSTSVGLPGRAGSWAESVVRGAAALCGEAREQRNVGAWVTHALLYLRETGH